MYPFNQDGRLSVSALQELASVAESSRRHIAGSGNFYTSADGATHSDPVTADANLAYVNASSATPQQVLLGRTITDGVVVGTSFTSNIAGFGSSDIGATVIGFGIPANTTINNVINSTTAVLSNAGASGGPETVQIVTGTIKAYSAQIISENGATGIWGAGSPPQTVWLEQANDSVWLPLVGGNEPVLVPVVAGQTYQCRFFANDASNVPIWTVAQVDNTKELETTAASVSLSTSWTTVTGLSLVLPAGQRWKATVQITASISSSSSGAFDSISIRLMDSSSTQWGVVGTLCNVVCASITFTDMGYLQGTGNGGVTLNVQAMINTSTGSTGTMTAGGIIAITL